jgi:hypothetical protein
MASKVTPGRLTDDRRGTSDGDFFSVCVPEGRHSLPLGLPPSRRTIMSDVKNGRRECLDVPVRPSLRGPASGAMM